MRKVINLTIAILFFLNNISFALGPQPVSNQPPKQEDMYAAGQKLFAAKFGPGSVDFDSLRKTVFQGRAPEIPDVKFKKPDYDNPGFFRAVYPMQKDVDLIDALRHFRDKETNILENELVSELIIEEGYFEVDEDEGELPISRLEHLGNNRYRLVVHTKFVQMWKHIKDNDIWFEHTFPDQTKRVVSLAWGIFYRLAKHEMAAVTKTTRAEKGGGHISGRGIHPKVELGANRIGGRYRYVNDAMWMWFLGAYSFNDQTRYNNDTLKERLEWFFNDTKARELELHEEFQNIVNPPIKDGRLRSQFTEQAKKDAIQLALAINYNFATQVETLEGVVDIPNYEELLVEEQYKTKYLERKTTIVGKSLYAAGRDAAGREERETREHAEQQAQTKKLRQAAGDLTNEDDIAFLLRLLEPEYRAKTQDLDRAARILDVGIIGMVIHEAMVKADIKPILEKRLAAVRTGEALESSGYIGNRRLSNFMSSVVERIISKFRTLDVSIIPEEEAREYGSGNIQLVIVQVGYSYFRISQTTSMTEGSSTQFNIARCMPTGKPLEEGVNRPEQREKFSKEAIAYIEKSLARRVFSPKYDQSIIIGDDIEIFTKTSRSHVKLTIYSPEKAIITTSDRPDKLNKKHVTRNPESITQYNTTRENGDTILIKNGKDIIKIHIAIKPEGGSELSIEAPKHISIDYRAAMEANASAAGSVFVAPSARMERQDRSEVPTHPDLRKQPPGPSIHEAKGSRPDDFANARDVLGDGDPCADNARQAQRKGARYQVIEVLGAAEGSAQRKAEDLKKAATGRDKTLTAIRLALSDAEEGKPIDDVLGHLTKCESSFAKGMAFAEYDYLQKPFIAKCQGILRRAIENVNRIQIESILTQMQTFTYDGRLTVKFRFDNTDITFPGSRELFQTKFVEYLERFDGDLDRILADRDNANFSEQLVITFLPTEEKTMFTIYRRDDDLLTTNVIVRGSIERIETEPQKKPPKGSRKKAAGTQPGSTKVSGSSAQGTAKPQSGTPTRTAKQVDAIIESRRDLSRPDLERLWLPTKADDDYKQVVYEWVLRIAKGEGPGSDKDRKTEEERLGVKATQGICELVKLYHGGEIDIIASQQRFGALTKRTGQVLTEVRKKYGKDALHWKKYDSKEHLRKKLERIQRKEKKNPSKVKRIILTEDEISNDIAELLDERPDLFRGIRVLNIKLPDDYGRVKGRDKTLYQLDIITRAVFARLYEQNSSPFVKAIVQNSFSDYVDDLEGFMKKLAEPKEESDEDIRRRIGFFLSKDAMVKFVELLDKNLRIMKLFWTFA